MSSTDLREISMAEVREHNTADCCWMAIDNFVYDVTRYIGEHPGGEDSLLEGAGTDATEAFNDVGHTDDARLILNKYKIGRLLETEISTGSTSRVSYINIKWSVATLVAAIFVGAVLKKSLGPKFLGLGS